jgi:hypothetical protein
VASTQATRNAHRLTLHQSRRLRATPQKSSSICALQAAIGRFATLAVANHNLTTRSVVAGMPEPRILTMLPIVARPEMDASNFRIQNWRHNYVGGSFLAYSDNSLTLAAMMKSFSWRPLILWV